MIKVIKSGSKKRPVIHKRKCERCGCEFTYLKEDISRFFDQGEGYHIWFIECPECKDCTGFEAPKEN